MSKDNSSPLHTLERAGVCVRLVNAKNGVELQSRTNNELFHSPVYPIIKEYLKANRESIGAELLERMVNGERRYQCGRESCEHSY